jgi:hypothetical protein
LCERRPLPTCSSAPDRKQEPYGLGTQPTRRELDEMGASSHCTSSIAIAIAPPRATRRSAFRKPNASAP